MDPITMIVGILICVVAGVAIGYFVARSLASGNLKKAQSEADQLIETATNKANTILKDAEAESKEKIIETKEEIIRRKQEAEDEERKRQKEVREWENRVISREESLDKRTTSLDKREQQLASRSGQIKNQEQRIQELLDERIAELERVSNLTTEEAKQTLLDELRHEVAGDAATIIREAEEEANAEADKNARRIISLAIQRYASDTTSDMTVSTVHIPSDDLKGRIIGREGRNIRSFEQISGVNLIIDDTPETVVLSSFDPVRREIARVALENLITDGRIHPARIEEMFKKAEEEIMQVVRDAGKQAAFDAGIHDMAKELIDTLGRLKFRTSYGQNVLTHSQEVSWIAGMMASELGLDPTVAKRAGLLHDLGKAVDHEVEGPHAVIGANLCRKYNESDEVIHAIEAHHNDVEPQTVVANLIIGADAISAARPGARRESTENYVKRLEQLEEISNAHDGVERTYAMQAGREVRVMVKPEDISDSESTVLAHDIAKEIEEKVQYPGQVKVVVVRESRSIDYAK